MLKRLKCWQLLEADADSKLNIYHIPFLQSHSCVEKAGMLAMVKLRMLETDDDFSLRGNTLARAIEEDRNLGLVPFFVRTIS